jgi:phosphatidylserine/phosphatidylglycerophosphate/cardiolipin synthase-like enzyme
MRALLGLALVAAAIGAAHAFEVPANSGKVVEGRGLIQVAFTPEDDAGALVVSAIDAAKKQVLVQAFSFTHREIARALVMARRRGVDVQFLADPDQHERIDTSQVDELAREVPVFMDGGHASAHNKVMVIDAGEPGATLVTGSFNFTQAAQYKNAENLLVIRGNPELVEAYRQNWFRHWKHSLRYKARR